MTARTRAATPSAATTTKRPATKRPATKKRAAPPGPLLIAPIATGDDEPLVTAQPGLGSAGPLRLHPAVRAAILDDPAGLSPHVTRLSGSFHQFEDGRREAYVRAWLGDDFPAVRDGADEAVMIAAMNAISAGVAARCVAVGFAHCFPDFGGKKLR